ncbi:substrate-binding domain-containing protein [Knoellia sp. Soil729]|uniref:substrate-binding domain-containing protein n=1 Tax=Knoellia sp. Soil729 TaxID=1736394 RepID=UPI000A842332|nr:substrate-binding domain-containing protein [Knoellia sp. Soil729]
MVALQMLTSMATRAVLEELAAPGVLAGLPPVELESAGGVVVAERIRSGESADLVVLAADAIHRLVDEGHVRPSVVALFTAEAVLAVPTGAPEPPLTSAQDLREALEAAAAIGYSTGPSGDGLLRLFEQWGLADTLRDRLVRAQPGVPVGALVAQRQVTLGVQQRSELQGLDGVQVVGPLPGDAAIRTTFTGGVLTASKRPEDGASALQHLGHLAGTDLAGSGLVDLVRRHGMEPSTP